MNSPANTKIAGKIGAGGCNMPTCDDYVFSVGMGTGIAPIRAMMEERLVDKKEGKKVAPAAMVFGNRYAEHEYYYKS